MNGNEASVMKAKREYYSNSTGLKRNTRMNRFAKLFLASLVFTIAVLTSACGGGGGSQGGGGGGQNPTTPTVTVTPASSTITTAQSLAVTVAV